MQKNSVHPNSRHAFQRSRIALRQRRLNEAQGVRNRVRSAKVDRIMTFVLLLSDEKTHLPDLYALHDFINTFYLGRHDDELAALQAEQRPGRPKSKQLLELEERIEKEKREYREGMEVPDLCNDINVSILREWQGDPQAMHLFRIGMYSF
ncbi:translation machinery-associated protein 16 [Malassezia japonica]|uniref:Translation machinery-associated protein 16 n=1 Tax=Malassezia japonica TaxID=223818 RepID=A0AAF0F0G3_9BASI|nr:translation machinery-associated protein 16 [Malassezia japonica]WFD37759.1 translation machinery-associated protein 16 [Malassezia japonica]